MSWLDQANSMLNGGEMNFEDVDNFGGRVKPSISRNKVQSKGGANLTFKITRATANIASALPIPLFAANQQYDGYQNMLAAKLGASLSITAFSTNGYSATQALASSRDFSFTFSDGSVTDIVTVRLDRIGYKTFMSNNATDRAYIKEMKFSVTAAADEAQFDQAIDFVKTSGYSSEVSNSIVPSDYKDSREQLSNIIHVNRFGSNKMDLGHIDRENGMIVPIKATASLTYSVNIRFSHTERL